MKLLDPSPSPKNLHAAYKRVAMPNGEDYFQWVNGVTNDVMYKLYMGKDGFQGCKRTDFLEEMTKLLPEENVVFGMEATELKELEDGRVEVGFVNGMSVVADVVIGADGIKSRVRRLLLGLDDPSSIPSYTGKYCFRALIPMPIAVSTLGPYRPSTRFMYNGPNAHIMTYPVASGTQLNVLTVITDPNPSGWNFPKHTTSGLKQDAIEAYKDFHPDVRAIINLLPEQMDKWAIFDMLENPAPAYNKGPVCLAGDAAHAAGPHLGSGAGFGLEDALVLVRTLKAAVEEEGNPSCSKTRAELVRRALDVYNEMRYHRTQWLIDHTRQSAALFQWQMDEGKESESFAREISWRFFRIWDYDVERMASEAAVRLKESTDTLFRYRYYN